MKPTIELTVGDTKLTLTDDLTGLTLNSGMLDRNAEVVDVLRSAGLAVDAALDLSPKTNAQGTYHNLIGGEWVEAASSTLYENTNPADVTHVLGNVPETTASEVARACELAERDFDAWRATSADFRTKSMLRVGELMRDQLEPLCAIVTQEMGKSLFDAKLDVLEAIGVVEAVAPQGTSMTGETYQDIITGLTMENRVAPRGPAGIITPFNFPIAIPIAQVMSALVTGNPVIWKPSHLVPESSQAIANMVLHALRETAMRWGVTIPTGIFSMVQGDAEAGDALVKHSAIRTVSFTGSKTVGDRVGALAESLGKCAMKECAGINLFYVHQSANIARAAKNFVYGKTITSGQRCTSIQEVLCDESVYDAFVKEVLTLVPNIVSGPGGSDAITAADAASDQFSLPPVVSKEQKKRFQAIVSESLEQGASLVYQQDLDTEMERAGYFVPFTLLGDVNEGNVLHHTEIFGPCGVLTKVSGLSEAIRIINTKTGIVGCIDATDKDASETFINRVLRTRIDDGRHGTGCFWATKFGGDRGAGSGNPALDEEMVYGYVIRKTIYRAYTPNDTQ